MARLSNLVYKITMASELQVDHYYNDIRAAAGVQMIHCNFCILRRWSHDNLRAPFWRWYWNDGPGAVIQAAGETIALAPERVVLIPSDAAFATQTRNVVGHLYIHFALGPRLAEQFREPIVRQPSTEELSAIRQLVELLRRADQLSQREWPLHFRTHALVAAALADIPSERWEQAAADANVARVLAVMHERPAAALDMQMLSSIASLSVNTLLRRFRQATGTTPHQYLCRLRVDRAGVELVNSDDAIEEIAQRNGFCDRYHLSRVFKQMLGLSPAAYRASRRDGLARN
jgi:AraC-like DNA-binding protein